VTCKDPPLADDYAVIEAIIRQRGITRLLHFSTNRGLVGTLASRALKSRALLNVDNYLERIFTPNALVRRDFPWTRHVSLSISRINASFFAASARWHAHDEVWWCVLEFAPVLLTHEGVVFVTTNNIYTGADRNTGAAGLEALFAERILQYRNLISVRGPDVPDELTTDAQAEVLYPVEVCTHHLRRVYVQNEHQAAVAEAQMAAVDHPSIPVEVQPEVFAAMAISW